MSSAQPATSRRESQSRPDAAHRFASEIAGNRFGEYSARVGISARGVVFLVLAYLVARIALGALGEGGTNKPASGPGVADAIAAQTGGRAVLALLGIGLELYALFSLLDAIRHHDDEAEGWKRWAERALPLWTMCVYAAFGIYCLVKAFGAGGDSQSASRSDRKQTQWSAEVLRWPAGWLWLGILGVVLFVIAAVQLLWAVKQRFRENLKEHEMSRRADQAVTVVGVTGHLGRALVFALVGWFVMAAAVENDPQKGKGVDGAARMLANSAGGPYLLGVLAFGLAAFGCYQFLEARYRKV